MADQNLIPFQFESHSIRVVQDSKGEFLVIARDVTAALGYGEWHVKLINHVPDEWKSKIMPESDSGREEWAFKEPGLYFFLSRSDKLKALPFQKWLAGDVVPSIRKTGSYSTDPETILTTLVANPAVLGRVLIEFAETREKLVAAEQRIEVDRPKVEFHDEVARQGEELTIREALKVIFNRAITERQLVDWLFRQQWLCRQGRGREPTAYAIDRGYMRCRFDYLPQIRQTVLIAVFTGKGIAHLRHLYRTGELFTGDIDRARLLAAPEHTV